MCKAFKCAIVLGRQNELWVGFEMLAYFRLHVMVGHFEHMIVEYSE